MANRAAHSRGSHQWQQRLQLQQRPKAAPDVAPYERVRLVQLSAVNVEELLHTRPRALVAKAIQQNQDARVRRCDVLRRVTVPA